MRAMRDQLGRVRHRSDLRPGKLQSRYAVRCRDRLVCVAGFTGVAPWPLEEGKDFV
jgi:hypothetical protein